MSEEQEDWDFDFSMYEKEEKETAEIKSIHDEKPNITNLRSRYSPSASMLDLVLIPLRQKIGEYAIKVESFSSDLNDLKTLYGCIGEYWASIKNIFGKQIIKEIKKIQNKCRELIIESEKKGSIDYKVHRWLLYYRDSVYKVSQYHNLGLEVEKASYGGFSKARKGMVE